MKAYSHITALQYWRGCSLDPPLHYATNSRAQRFSDERTLVHYASQLRLRGMTRPTDSGNHVASPELCLLQQASSTTLVQLILLVDEFCGTYRINEAAPFGFQAADALTNLSSLNRFCAKVQGMSGVKALRRALPFAVEGAASPKEAQLELLLCLPQRLGGYALAKPQMNFRIALSSAKARKLGQHTFFCDLYWPEAKLAIEYDSDLCHAAEQRIASDARRRDILDTLGVRVITVTHAQFGSMAEMERVACKVGGLIDCRVRTHSPDFKKRCLQLRRSFYAS